MESWLPFVGRFLPKDEITISKRGERIRVDTHMLEFKGMKWRDVGPYRGGRVLAVTGVSGSPYTYYFGSVGGGVWRSGMI